MNGPTVPILAVLAPGQAEGALARLSEPLSFWGGFNSATGTIIDRAHGDVGRSLQATVTVMTQARGSSSSSSVLAEAIRLGTAPAGIVLGARDPILPVGAIVADRLYGRQCPIVVVADLDAFRDGWIATIDTGTLRIRLRPAKTEVESCAGAQG